ncbi:MAG: polysaccharide pyruvyl transferase family protein, partial [Pseudomonadota bacterium]
TIFVPHWEKMGDQVLLAAARSAGLEVVDPRQDPETVIQRLRSASKVIADSMHAAIIADALGVPWVPVATSRNISSFKWIDWASSLGVPYEPTLLPQGTTQMALRSLLKRRVVGTQFTGAGKEAALANYRDLSRRIAAPDFEKNRYRGLYRVDRLVDLSKSTWLRPSVARFLDQRRAERLAMQLQRASERAGYLSDAARRKGVAEHLVLLLEKLATRNG